MSKKVKRTKNEVYVRFTDLSNLEWLIIDEVAHHSVLNKKLTEEEMKQLLIDIEEVFDKKAIFTAKEI